MTGMERIGALMQGQLPDKVPVVCNLLEQGARELGMSIREYYTSGENVARGQIALRNKYDYDAVQGFFYAGHLAEMLGCKKMIYADDGPPNVGHMVIDTPDDIEKLEIPDDIETHPQFAETARCIGLLKEELGGKYPVIGSVVSSFSLPPLLMGIEKWIEMLGFGPDAARAELLEKCSLFVGRYTAALRSAGADMISYSNPVASPHLVSERMFKTLALPAIKNDTAKTGTDGMVYFNGGAPINPVIETLITEVGFGGFYINPMDDPGEAKRIVNGRGLSSGVINDIMLIEWTKEEIEEEVKRIMTAGAPGGGFVFGTLVMPLPIPEDSIKIMMEAARKYGDYAGYLAGLSA